MAGGRMQDLMTRWKADIVRTDNRLERRCQHGVGHPVAHVRGYLKRSELVHGCDGCCRAWERQSTDKEMDEEPR